MEHADVSPAPELWSVQYIEGEDEEAGNEWYEIVSADGNEVCTLMIRNAKKWREQMQPIHEPNAHLIAASPTLYKYAKERAGNGDSQARAMLDSLNLPYIGATAKNGGVPLRTTDS